VVYERSVIISVISPASKVVLVQQMQQMALRRAIVDVDVLTLTRHVKVKAGGADVLKCDLYTQVAFRLEEIASY
jgi:hypothetical protein